MLFEKSWFSSCAIFFRNLLLNTFRHVFGIGVGQFISKAWRNPKVILRGNPLATHLDYFRWFWWKLIVQLLQKFRWFFFLEFLRVLLWGSLRRFLCKLIPHFFFFFFCFGNRNFFVNLTSKLNCEFLNFPRNCLRFYKEMSEGIHKEINERVTKKYIKGIVKWFCKIIIWKIPNLLY